MIFPVTHILKLIICFLNGLVFKNRCHTKFIFSIWEYDCINKPDKNKYKCLWCGITFQGIHDNKAMARVMGTTVMNIKSCNGAIDKSHLSKYKYIHTYKSSKRSVMNYHLHKVNYSIAHI